VRPVRRPVRNIALVLFFGCAAGVGIAALLLQQPGDKTYTVPSEAMEPTYSLGEEVKVDEDAYDDAEPVPGDVVALNPPAGAIVGKGCGTQRIPGEPCPQPTPELDEEVVFIKRVIALAGQSVAITGGRAVVQGETLEEDYIRPCAEKAACQLPVPITVPDGHVFLLGDNRGASEDSRFWGPAPLEAITGRVVED
jgi:signal peptidase I